MTESLVLINGQWKEAAFPVSSFRAVNPANRTLFCESYPVSSFLDLDEMLQADLSCRKEMAAVNQKSRSEFLATIADKIYERKQELCEMASSETALDVAQNLEPSLMRMITRLRLAVKACLDSSATDQNNAEEADFSIVKQSLAGPVVLLGPASSPFELSPCGGADFVCAVAAGNTVIAKGGYSHPQTSKILAEIIAEAAKNNGLPGSCFQFFYHTTEDLGHRLAAHPMLGALAFIGSKRASVELKKSADISGNLSFLGLAGVNVAMVMPGAVEKRSEQIASEIAAAVMADSGQHCNKPNLVFVVESKSGSKFIRSIGEKLNEKTAGPMVSEQAARNVDAVVSNQLRLGAKKLTIKEFYQPKPFIYPNTALIVDIKTYLKFASQFQEEAFGPVVMFVTLENPGQFELAARTLDGGSESFLYFDAKADRTQYSTIINNVSHKFGRVQFNCIRAASLEVNEKMCSKAFPVTTFPGYSFMNLESAIRRFSLCRCYDGGSLPK